MSFPVGFRFYPSDRELVFDYLYRKVIGKPLPCEHVVMECDLYGERDPWQIFGGSSEKVGYFFTKLKKKTNSGSRIDRTVGSGTWKGQDGGNSVLDEQGRCIGQKKMLAYEKKGSAMNHGRWIMHEYALGGDLLKEAQCDDIVLCRIRKKELNEERNSGQSTETVEPDHTPSSELTAFTDLLLMEPVCVSNEENDSTIIQIENRQTLEAEIKINETLQTEHTTSTTFPDLLLMAPEDYMSINIEEMLPKINADDEQTELSVTSNIGAAWAQSNAVSDENMLVISSFVPTFDAGEYILEDKYAWALKSESKQVFSVELDALAMGENLFGSKGGRDVITPSKLTLIPRTIAPKLSSPIDCARDDGLPAVGGDLVEHLDLKDGETNCTDWVRNFASQLLGKKKEPIEKNQIDMLANMKYEENWGFMLKKRRTE